jgi:hypothetical protein
MTLQDSAAPATDRRRAMTGAEFARAIAYIGLAEDDAAQVLRVSAATLKRWIAGSEEIPSRLARRLRLMVSPEVGFDMECLEADPVEVA